MNARQWRVLEGAPVDIQERYAQLLQELETLSVQPGNNALAVASAAWKASRVALNWLKTYLEQHPIVAVEAEIIFFKKIKPVFQQEYLYWMSVFEGWLHFPMGTEKAVKKYVQQQLDSLAHFQQVHTAFFQYLRLERTDLDRQYFTRQSSGDEELLDPLLLDRDRTWSTGYDVLVARYWANERLVAYWQQVLVTSTEQPAPTGPEQKYLPLRWTASKAALVELIYALQSSGVYNNGQVELKQLVNFFSHYFQVDLGNFYHVFNEIRLRKKNRTQLLDLLKEKVVAKMDELDLN